MRRSLRGTILAFAVVFVLGAGASRAVVPIRIARPISPQSFIGDYPSGKNVFLFDMGTEVSPRHKSFVRVLKDDVYSRVKGYGFEGAPAGAEFLTDDIENQGPLSPWPVRVREGIYGVDDLTTDYVVDKRLVFKVDVPPGRYDVIAVVGHMFPAYHVYVKVNGKEGLTDADIFTYHHYRRGHRADGTYGAWYKVWSVADASEGQVRVEVYGDETAGKRTFQFEVSTSSGDIEPFVEDYAVSGPYKEAGLMGVVIVPHTEPQVLFAGDKLKAAANSPAKLASAVEAFNKGDVERVKTILAAITEPQLQFGKGIVYMALAGTPLLDEDWEMLDAARSAFDAAVKTDPSNYTARILRAQCDQFGAGLNLYVDRRNVAGTEVSATGRFHRVHMLHRQFPADHPFYLKALIYKGRMFRALVPTTKCAKSWEGLWALEEVEKKYPDNKYVKLYLHDEWSVEDWPLDNYESPPGTPAWADGLRRAFAQGIDFGDWWAEHGQAEDGAIGGGWTDDVEVMPFWGLLSMIDPSGMPQCVAMLDKFTNGLWNSVYIDQDRVFEPQFADAEHSAEPTGDGINYLIGVKYGHPLWIERNMIHAKLNRDFLTGFNARGMRLYRSGDMSASRYGTNHDPADQKYQNEDAICLRAFRSAPWLVWYNANPGALELLLEKADACHAVAMGTESGKPRGIIPNAVMWDGRPGGHKESHGSGQGDSGGYAGAWYLGGFEGKWPGRYMSHYNNLLISAFVASGDEKYLEPFYAQYEFIKKMHPDGKFTEFPDPEFGSDEWVANGLLGGKAKLMLALTQIRLLTEDRTFDDLLMDRAGGWARYRLTGDKQTVVQDMGQVGDWLKLRWPHMTTEATQTDRIAYYPRMVSFYLGADVGSIFEGLPLMAVTYSGGGKHFAGLVERSSLRDLKLHLYTFYERPRTIGIRPWLLEPGAEYTLRYGVDADDDGAIDNIIAETDFTLEARGMRLDLDVPPQKIVTVEIAQTKAPEGAVSSVPPDLAVCPEDIRHILIPPRNASELDITVHNIGGTDANDVIVEVYLQKPGGQPELIETAIISRIEAPLRLDPQYTRIGVWGHQGKLADGDTIIVKVDPQDQIHELNEQNNVAQQVIHLEKTAETPKEEPPAAASSSRPPPAPGARTRR